jgi:Arc/MetJ-type ribon-helix-helix transcriptional regulator
MRRFILKLNENDDADLIEMIESVPRPFRGMYIKNALRLDLDKAKDKDIIQGLPAIDSPFRRYDLVKEALRLLIRSQTQERHHDGKKYPKKPDLGLLG